LVFQQTAVLLADVKGYLPYSAWTLDEDNWFLTSEHFGLYALRRKKFRRKQVFTSEDAAKLRVRGKNSFGKIFFGKIFFGEQEHNQHFHQFRLAL
jgi:hypothetical protein